tara:strand:- start:453 stop:1118 length:666 start_codon:yes stop_codon:yes gene_type:complete
LEDKEVNIILFGPPGAGKGTQADNIVKKFNLHKISTGDLLRDEIKNKTSLGNEINTTITKGKFVSDEIINSLIGKTMSDKSFFNRLIFDGYPRNINQAQSLDSQLKKYKQKLLCVLCLNVDKASIIKRILGRQTCTKCGLIFNEHFQPATNKNHKCGPKFLTKRSDDNEKTIINRFETYLKKTLPILDFYREQNLLHEVNGMGEINQIFEEICGIIASLEA